MFPPFSISPSEMNVTNNLVSLMNQLKRSSSVDRLHNTASFGGDGNFSALSGRMEQRPSEEGGSISIHSDDENDLSYGVTSKLMMRSLSNENILPGSFIFSKLSMTSRGTVNYCEHDETGQLPPFSGISDKSNVKFKAAKQNVSFSNRCSVVLIPSRKEYIDAGIDLWISKFEQSVAQAEVAEEVRGLLDHNPALTIRMAISFLYQPRLSDENEEKNIPIDESSSSMRLSESNGMTSSECSSRLSSASESGKISSPAGSSTQYSDSKERLNILIVDSSMDSFEATKTALKEVLLPYQRWVISCKHCSSDVEALELLYKSTNVVNKIDVIIVDQSICEMMDDQHDSDVKTLILDIKSASDNAVVGLVIHQVDITDGSKTMSVLGKDFVDCNGDYRGHELHLELCKQETYKEAAKKANIDFIWRKPTKYFIPMLPMILSAAQAIKLKSLNPSYNKPYESPQRTQRKSLRSSF